MPLTAYVNSKKVVGILTSDPEWGALRSLAKSEPEALVVPCCKNQVFPRTSPLGTRHFVHRKHDRACPWKREKPLELLAKAEIVLACHAAGYDVETDVRGEGWRADVLARRTRADGSSLTLVFQVRWRRHKPEDVLEHEALTREGMRVCWFVRRVANGTLPREEVPLFVIAPTEDERGVEVEHSEWVIPLREFVVNLLARKIKFRHARTGRVDEAVQFFLRVVKCARCKTSGLVHFVFPTDPKTCSRTTCGASPAKHVFRHTLDPFDSRVVGITAAFLRERPDLPPAYVVRERDLPEFGRRYSFGCPKCDQAVGAGLLLGDDEEVLAHPEEAVARFDATLPQRLVTDEPHWCFPEDGRFCGDAHVEEPPVALKEEGADSPGVSP